MPGELVLDAGALIALERGDKDLIAAISVSRELGFRVTTPTSVLAQVWRGGPRSAALSRLVDVTAVDALDEQRAKQVGVRLGLRDASDIADAHVVCCALEHRAVVATSDAADIRALLDPRERLALIPV